MFALYANGLLAAHYGPNSFFHSLAMAIISDPATAILAAFLFICTTRIGYQVAFFSSKFRATIGMLCVRLKLSAIDGVDSPLSVLVLRRCLAASISYALFFAGFLYAFANENRQTLHDRLSKTLVVS